MSFRKMWSLFMHHETTKNIRVGITGQAGFIGSHLYNSLRLNPEKYITVPFLDEFFDDIQKLKSFVDSCDVIIHLAGVNRHHDLSELYAMNVALAEKLIASLADSKDRKHVIFSSSIQENVENSYGKAKRDAREMLSAWADRSNNSFSGLIIPNVFGAFGRPFYNSVVATFAHQLTHGITPKIDVDSELSLINVADLVTEILCIIDEKHVGKLVIKPRHQISVSKVLNLMMKFKEKYFLKGEIPQIANEFELQLFNVFRASISLKEFFPFYYKINEDERGRFIEVARLGIGGQVSYSTTKPGITRGNHFHTRKIERFSVVKGRAKISLRRIGTDEVIDFLLDESEPAFVDMPIWYTHNITNIGDSELITFFWINEPYNSSDPDTYFEAVENKD